MNHKQRMYSLSVCSVANYMQRLLLVTVTVLATTADVNGGTFQSGSDGSDGALDLTGETGVVVFDPSALGLDVDRDNVFHFTTVLIPAEVTLRLRAPDLQFAPVYWLCTGDVRIDGVIDLGGDDGHDDQVGNRRPSIPGPGGFPGGEGDTVDSLPRSGLGPGGGVARQGGGHVDAGVYCTGTRNNTTYGNAFLIPLIGGSGGGGGRSGFGGGAGGGAMLIASDTSIFLDGAIHADGGDGAGPGTANCTIGSGGGAGGAIRLLTPNFQGSGTVSAVGGTRMKRGSEGRIRIEATTSSFSGVLLGSSRVVPLSPNAVIAPTPIPTVRVISIGGQAVPSVPTGDLVPPDVTIDTDMLVELIVEVENVAVTGNLVLRISQDTGPDQTVSASYLSGDETMSTWSASAFFPHGFSRVLARATWSP